MNCTHQITKPTYKTHKRRLGRKGATSNSLISARVILICSLLAIMASILVSPSVVEGSWWFGSSSATPDQQTSQQIAAKQSSRQLEQQQALPEAASPSVQAEKTAQTVLSQTTGSSELGSASGQSGYNYGSYGSSLLSIAGIQPSSIATVLNTVGDTGFKYFNIHDQCRNRAACDLGYLLFKRLSFVHNWLVRTSVRTLVDMNNIYAQSWMEGMLGKNCTAIYTACRQSPLEGFMNLAMLQRMVM